MLRLYNNINNLSKFINAYGEMNKGFVSTVEAWSRMNTGFVSNMEALNRANMNFVSTIDAWSRMNTGFISSMNALSTANTHLGSNLEALHRTNTGFISTLKAFDTLSDFNKSYVNHLSSQMSSLLKSINKPYIFEPYDKLSELYKKFNIDEQTLSQTLNDYQWCLLPEMSIEFILKIITYSYMPDARKMINQHFFSYFADNDYENLIDLIEYWEICEKFRPGRLKIINDCLNAITNAKDGKIPSTLIVPTLIAQIDGIQQEFLIENDFKIDRTRYVHPSTGKKMGQQEAWRDTYDPDDTISSITNDIILDVLFATAYPGKPIKTPINFSRHKIMHGERLDYGTKYNVIRTFLILDFLHNLF